LSPPRSTHRRDSNQKHDYRDVDPRFGTLAELDALLAAAHARGLKIILEFAPNHTSDAHRWFRAARTSRDDEQRDWYLWRDAARDGGPPSTWLAHFGVQPGNRSKRSSERIRTCRRCRASARPLLDGRERV
jgi:glycosidase